MYVYVSMAYEQWVFEIIRHIDGLVKDGSNSIAGVTAV